VVVVEHALSHLGPPAARETRVRHIVDAMAEVARPVVFGVIIVLLVFLPLATLEDVEGKMFRPVVYSLCFMLFGALVYALIVIPAIAPLLFYKADGSREPWLARQLRRAYRPVLRLALARPITTVCASLLVAAGMLAPAATLGADFLPRIFEGSFAIDALRPPSVSLSQAIRFGAETERALLKSPEVLTVINRIGRPEQSVDPAGPESSDVFVILKPRGQWRTGMTPERLVEELSSEVEKAVPATINAFSQPIEMRVNDLIAGAKGDVVVKVYGEDLETMRTAANSIRQTLATVPGAADVKMEIPTGLPSIRVAIDRDRAARVGVNPRSALEVLGHDPRG
jgi:cobalt-zinc-cadmium resistance protein CzcA